MKKAHNVSIIKSRQIMTFSVYSVPKFILEYTDMCLYSM